MNKPIRPRGISDKDWNQFLADHEKLEEAFKKKVCPKCGGAMLRIGPDVRQAGPSAQPGVWVKYQCARKCGWFMDRKEAN